MAARGHMQVVGQKAQPSPLSAICDISMRCDAMRYADGWRPLGWHRYQYPLAAAVMAGQNIKMQVEIRDHLCSSWRYRYTPWRLVMRATLLCCVAHTCPSMEYMPPHMPLKQGAYEHVRIRSELRVRTVAFAPYIGNPAAFLLSLGPTYRHCSAVSYVKQSNGPCWVSFKAGELQRARRCGSVY
jgi:hypothetical protein